MEEKSLQQFALDLYSQEGIAPLCLAWQDQHSIDVTVLLMAAWAGTRGYRLSPADIAASSDAVARWRSEIIAPLRAVRRRLKEPFGQVKPEERTQLREKVSAAELDSEFIALRILGDFGTAESTEIAPETAVPENVSAVFAHFSDDAPQSAGDVELIARTALRVGNNPL
ncbi:TIGR02444 family protein [Bradyrhizobium sp. ma5]|uniref:TIGR02444 family protein n=1 Tax=Bradyrhizobium sp. ma5 TaxID=3344828 RepID=UPI0035D4DE39